MSALSPNTTVNTPTTPSPSSGMNYGQVENIWIQAGGNPQAAAMAAAVADAASGLNPNATYTNPDGTQTVGLWLIQSNGSPPGSTDPIANARAAIQQSSNGQDWSQWCVAWSDNNCGQSGGTYLGDGSNALASLGQRLTPASYNVIGSAPTGAGTSASTAASPNTPTSTSSKHTLLVVAIIILLVIAVMWLARRKSGEGIRGEAAVNRSQAPWTATEEARLSDTGITDKQLSQETGRTVRAIRVRRNQLKG